MLSSTSPSWFLKLPIISLKRLYVVVIWKQKNMYPLKSTVCCCTPYLLSTHRVCLNTNNYVNIWNAIPALWYLFSLFMVVFHYMRWLHHYLWWLIHYIRYLVCYMWCMVYYRRCLFSSYAVLTAFYGVIFSLYAVLFLLCAVANSLYAVLFSLCTEVKSLYAVPFLARPFSRRTWCFFHYVRWLFHYTRCFFHYTHGTSFLLDLKRGQLRMEVKMQLVFLTQFR